MSKPYQTWPSNWNLIERKIDQYHLLGHPFYQSWAEGRLPKSALRTYAGQYYRHVAAFPTYLSALHARAEDSKTRRVILENLVDEEYKSPTHPELWLRFAEGLGMDRAQVQEASSFPEARRVVSTFRKICSDRPLYQGVALLYAYEAMTPRIAATKAEGLRSFYGIRSARATRYFTLHEDLDRRHAAQWRRILKEAISSPGKARAAAESVETGMKSIWSLLTAVLNRSGAVRRSQMAASC